MRTPKKNKKHLFEIYKWSAHISHVTLRWLVAWMLHYIDCCARLFSDFSVEMTRFGVQTKQLPLPRYNQPDSSTWQEHENASAKARRNICMHAHVEFLLDHLAGSQVDTSQPTRKERSTLEFELRGSPLGLSRTSTVVDIKTMAATSPSGLSRTSTVVNTNAMAATLDLEFNAHGDAHEANLPARNFSPIIPISNHQFMPLGMMAVMMAKTMSEKAGKSSLAKRKRG